jgi:hypothetical protein
LESEWPDPDRLRSALRRGAMGTIVITGVEAPDSGT